MSYKFNERPDLTLFLLLSNNFVIFLVSDLNCLYFGLLDIFNICYCLFIPEVL